MPDSLAKTIKKGSDIVYPEKIKNAESITCSFAICYDKDNKIIPLNGLYYATLPTQGSLGLSYHINSAFILTLNRTQLLENEWNEYIIYLFGYSQLYLLRHLVKYTPLKNQVAKIFKDKASHIYKQFTNAYLKGFNETKTEITWLPAYKSSKLLKLDEAWLDNLGFFKKFITINDPKIIPFLVDYELAHTSNLSKTHGINIFDIECLFNKLPDYVFQLNNQGYKQLLYFLYDITTKYSYNNINQPFLKTLNNTLVAPKNAYLLTDEMISLPETFKIDPLNASLLPKDNEIKTWLSKLGVTELKPIEIIRKSVFTWIAENKVTIQNDLEVLSYLANTLDSVELNNSDITNLKKLPVLTKANNFRKVSECYLPNTMQPAEPLEGIIDNKFIVSSRYTPNLKKLLIRLGAQEKLIIEELNFNTTDIENTPLNNTFYHNYLKMKFMRSSKKSSWMETKELASLYIPYIDKFINPSYAQLFWKNFLLAWDIMGIEHFANVKKINDGTQTYIQHYFYINNFLLGSDNKLHSSKELYSSKMQSICEVAPNIFPSFINKEPLPASLEEYLGFKDRLYFDNILKLFKHLKDYPKKLGVDFFKALLSQLQYLSNDEKVRLKQHSHEIILLSEKNILKPANTLYYFKDDIAEAPLNSEIYLKRFPQISHQEMLDLASWCGVNIIPFKVELTFINKEADQTFKEFVLQRLPIIAIQEAHCINSDSYQVLEALYKISVTIHLYRCSGLSIKYPFQVKSTLTPIYFEGNNIFVSEQWNKSRAKAKIYEKLAKLLELNKDISEISKLKTSEMIEDWLNEQGYSFDNYLALTKYLNDILKNFPEQSQEKTAGNTPTMLVPSEPSQPKSDAFISNTIEEIYNVNETAMHLPPPQAATKSQPSKAKPLQKNSISSTSHQPSISSAHHTADLARKIQSSSINKPQESQTLNNKSLKRYESDLTTHTVSYESSYTPQAFSDNGPYTKQLGIINTDSLLKPLVHPMTFFQPSTGLTFKTQDIGYNGEKYMFESIQKAFRQLYPQASITLHDNTFNLQINRSLTIGIVWLNKNIESQNPYDIVIIENGVIKEFIEVKTTHKPNKRKFEVSDAELHAMYSYKEKYTIYHILNAANPNQILFERLENPAYLIKQGFITLSPLQYTASYQLK